ncbi:hypothetical protein PTTG_25621 [Puccinia triticina 1-1 BBBD Race 1]|uniref:t-SNARE coiled-coil homology domain-containing protein n=1 Tax=Puccinia triticina (isolate 1-1 / race 1 (BBBD)) TaxID=630390 RepID=A0A180H268_PUCT1|nr:hypothetical protein PTTG_25621 [Puccinia triticina 1-1 BBBD Race 1]
MMMSKNDPYFEVRAEVESSLHAAAALYSSYNRILLTLPAESRAASEELGSTRAELRSTLSTLAYDISELDDVVRVLEEDLSPSSTTTTTTTAAAHRKSKFGVSLDEVRKRRAWLAEVQQQVKTMRETVEMPLDSNPGRSTYHPLLPSPTSPAAHRTPPGAQSDRRSRPPGGQPRSRLGDDLEAQRGAEQDTEEFYHHQEAMMMRQQDQTLGTISGVVDVLREQASLMGQELSEQNEMLDGLEDGIDGAESKLARASRTLHAFVGQNKNSTSSWAILILIIVLTILLMAILLT